MQIATAFPERLITAHFVLRRYGVQHAAGIKRLVEMNRDRLLRSFPDIAKGLLTVDAAMAFVSDKVTQWDERKAFCYGIWHRTGGEQRGQLTVKNIDWRVPSAELCYFVGRSWLRGGLASEAIIAVVRVAFEEHAFRRVFVRIIAGNTDSLSLAAKLGFSHEGVHSNDYRCGLDEIHDVHYFSMTHLEYRLGLQATAAVELAGG